MDKMRGYVIKVQELEAAAKVIQRWQFTFELVVVMMYVVSQHVLGMSSPSA